MLPTYSLTHISLCHCFSRNDTQAYHNKSETNSSSSFSSSSSSSSSFLSFIPPCLSSRGGRQGRARHKPSTHKGILSPLVHPFLSLQSFITITGVLIPPARLHTRRRPPPPSNHLSACRAQEASTPSFGAGCVTISVS